jgi:WD40 repeat protein
MTLRAWDAATGACLKVLKGHSDGVLSVSWSPDSSKLASGSDDYMVRVWDAETGECLK